MNGKPCRCPICGSTAIVLFVDVENMPLFCNVLYPTEEEARRALRGRITLGFCRSCTHIYNYAFEPQRMSYTEAYENSLHFSPHFQEYAAQLAQDLMNRYDVTNKTVLDIGCGKGEFLSLICTLGNNRGVGFDASYQPERAQNTAERLTIIRDQYAARYANYRADLICCRHVLEHIADPASFVRLVHEASLHAKDAIVYVEVPNALWMLHHHSVWDVIYEHCSYFTPTSLRLLFMRQGFKVVRLYEGFDGQYLSLECRPNTDTRTDEDASLSDADVQLRLVQAFASRRREMIVHWDAILQQADRKRIAVWGSGSKGVTFLNMLHHADRIASVVDINPRKQGKYVAGTAHCVVSPEDLRHHQPDVVIVMNPVYEREIRSSLRTLGITPEILLA